MQLKGVIPALVTPFDSNGKIDFARFEKLLVKLDRLLRGSTAIQCPTDVQRGGEGSLDVQDRATLEVSAVWIAQIVTEQTRHELRDVRQQLCGDLICMRRYRNSCGKPLVLSYQPGRHEAAVTDTGNTDAPRVGDSPFDQKITPLVKPAMKT